MRVPAHWLSSFPQACRCSTAATPVCSVEQDDSVTSRLGRCWLPGEGHATACSTKVSLHEHGAGRHAAYVPRRRTGLWQSRLQRLCLRTQLRTCSRTDCPNSRASRATHTCRHASTSPVSKRRERNTFYTCQKSRPECELEYTHAHVRLPPKHSVSFATHSVPANVSRLWRAAARNRSRCMKSDYTCPVWTNAWVWRPSARLRVRGQSSDVGTCLHTWLTAQDDGSASEPCDFATMDAQEVRRAHSGLIGALRDLERHAPGISNVGKLLRRVQREGLALDERHPARLAGARNNLSGTLASASWPWPAQCTTRPFESQTALTFRGPQGDCRLITHETKQNRRRPPG
jgi:hypothetical protein